ncbi:hypothetical protein BRDID11002_50370 [Bradyrhizobium diazoefficiens]
MVENGGQPNQFVGDGMLALFGLSADPQEACRQALKAAAGIATHIDELNELLSHDLRQPIRFGIGIHGGEVIIGDIGYRDHIVFTALGDARQRRRPPPGYDQDAGLARPSSRRRSAAPRASPTTRCRSRRSRSAAATSQWPCAWLRTPGSWRCWSIAARGWRR